MDPIEIPTNIKKTLGLLKNQMKKAKLPGTCIISENEIEIVYQEESRSYKISVEDTKQESDAEKLHLRMPEFLDDLRISIEALNDETNDSIEVSNEDIYNLTEESDDDVGSSINTSDEVNKYSIVVSYRDVDISSDDDSSCDNCIPDD
ncbi:26259_t:CDS:2, partial [Gigaspora margarita]